MSEREGVKKPGLKRPSIRPGAVRFVTEQEQKHLPAPVSETQLEMKPDKSPMPGDGLPGAPVGAPPAPIAAPLLVPASARVVRGLFRGRLAPAAAAAAPRPEPVAAPVAAAAPRPEEPAAAVTAPKPEAAVAAPKPEAAVAAPKPEAAVPPAPKPEPTPKDKALAQLKKFFDSLARKGIELTDLPTETKDDHTFYKMNLEITEEDLRLLDGDFPAFRFYPNGLEILDDDDLPDKFGDLTLAMEKAEKIVKASAPAAAAAAAPVTKRRVVIKTARPTIAPEAATMADMDKDPVLKPLLEAIMMEEKKEPFETALSENGYVPQTRRGFAKFIRETYERFTLDPPPLEPDYTACERLGSGELTTQLYQAFVRDYMRNASPYRGILVYHGLGSGKTCTSIATAEALFGTANKKIIVMTPFSLRKNFLKEITFCGFRHFRLNNHWVSFPNNPEKDPLVRLFAQNVLSIPAAHLRKAKHIWIPDFTRPANYKELSATAQTEIREQIQAILVRDRDKGLEGRIQFINYNGISAAKLKEIGCTQPDFFDNAIIVVDEIHNLIRLMQGTIEPYLMTIKGVRRKVKLEPIEVERKTPDLCNRGQNYKRGYWFYRMLLQAKNSKIVGLSGTPLINFPEELAILANVLHGYIPITTISVPRGASVDADEVNARRIENLGMAHPYVDFIRAAVQDRAIQVTFTVLDEGVRKVAGKEGVERIPLGEPTISPLERIASFIQYLKDQGIKVPEKPTIKAEPLLPPIGETFRNTFLDEDNTDVQKNRKIVLINRLTGLVSYYKGSRKELMPEIKKDEYVFVPFSQYAQEKYSAIRLGEIDLEEKTKTKEGAPAAFQQAKTATLWAEILEIQRMKNSANYRMASRQACNFTFPPGVHRPRPQDEAEANLEVGQDVKEIVDPPVEEGADDELAEILEEDEVASVAAEGEDEAIEKADATAAMERELEDLRAALTTEGKPAEEIQAAIDARKKELQAELGLAEVLLVEEEEAADAAASAAAGAAVGAEARRCKATSLSGESYGDRIKRAKECLSTVGHDYLLYENPDGLRRISPKFYEIFKRIREAPGTSLVYSQFLDMEGIGILGVVLEANGYDPIEIRVNRFGGAEFSEKTIESLKKGPASGQKRYIKFTGGEKDVARRMAIDIFNARFNELAAPFKKIFTEAGYTTNQKGEVCQLFCITGAGAEGISLKNVRAVHIMEPYWNDVRMAQVKGRAVRICSHMDLPVPERNVSIYTYVSVFGEEAQKAKEYPMRIDETIRNTDSLPADQARKLGLPVPEGITEYVMTSDIRLFRISEKKKTLIQNLELVMKSGAVDCALNYPENKDGTFRCLALEGKVGDFLYHPDLAIDIEETSAKIRLAEAPGAAAAAAAAPAGAAGAASVVATAPPKRVFREYVTMYPGEAFKGKKFELVPVMEEDQEIPVRYDVFLQGDRKQVLGKVTVMPDGKPNPKGTTFFKTPVAKP